MASLFVMRVIMFLNIPNIVAAYLNRYHKGDRLCADPTVKFALHDQTIKRILFRHLQVDSPYNTYKHTGLPRDQS